MALADRKKRYTRYASECLRLAELAKNSDEKNLLIQMAETWRELADLAEGPQKWDKN